MVWNGIQRVCFDVLLHEKEFRVVFSSAEWFGTEFRQFASILDPRYGILSCVLFRRRVRNRVMGVYFYFCSTERNSELFSLPRKGSERNCFLFHGTTGIPLEITICSVYSVFRGIIFCRKFPTPVETNQINSLTGDTTTDIHRTNEVPSLLLSPSLACLSTFSRFSDCATPPRPSSASWTGCSSTCPSCHHIMASRTLEEDYDHLRQFFTILQENCLQINPAKCLFAASAVEFLGHCVNQHGVCPFQRHVQAISDFPTPQDVEQYNSF
jgi:hypothetical protein